MNLIRAKTDITVGLLLTVSGGFLDAFAYVGHGGVFANAMTGNVALMGINLAAGNWHQGLRHFPPIVAFLLAVLLAHVFELLPTRSESLRHPAIACLLLELVFMVAVASGLIALPDAGLIPAISFVATLQAATFTHIAGLSYNSVMTSGNLRSFGQRLAAGLLPRTDLQSLRSARLLGVVVLCFFAGTVIGALATTHLGAQALWVEAALLSAAMVQFVLIAVSPSPSP
ncbi:YoaK family protein [Amantichitinum ursilacus]|uniref:DUF1275 domain-containing protein n=1 Tax=Amantichitinum ursilacus TaxID=857265 RepID=A0A0N0GQY1_9NEIS|nr:YoaK family protein [Amantichitinum ursilacus]KPC55161.1 hypothetical protein WG78_00840 [Amantichitinum ursilacus]